MKRKITLKFIFDKLYCRQKFNIFIKDSSDHIIYEAEFNNCDSLYLYLSCYELYRFKIYLNNSLCPLFSSNFYVSPNTNSLYEFNFVKTSNNPPLITFHLYDKNYQNLKIEKGMISLWQENMIL